MTKEEFYERYLKGDYEIFNAWEDGLTGQCDMVVKDDDGTPWMLQVGWYGYMQRPQMGGFFDWAEDPVKAKPVIGVVEYVPVDEEEDECRS